MTKSETLQSYRTSSTGFEHIWDSWLALGCNEITESSKIFAEGIIYKINIPTLGNCHNNLIYCKKELLGSIDWSTYEVSDYNYGEISFQPEIVSPNFDLLLVAEEFKHVIHEENSKYTPYDSSFIPFTEEVGIEGKVSISESDYKLCTKSIGYPFIQDEELEYSREDIINLAIRPALERYFKYFPKTQIETYQITGQEQIVEFPTNAYDVIHFSVQQSNLGGSQTGVITNTWLRYWDERMYLGGSFNGMNGYYYGTTRPTTQTSDVSSWLLGRAANQALINYRTRYHLDKFRDKDGKLKLRFYSNKMGLAEVHYAIQTLDFNDVEFARRPELIKLCNAEVKKLFGSIRRQVKSDIPGTVNYSEWVSEADKEIEEVETNWKSIVKYSSLIRGHS